MGLMPKKTGQEKPKTTGKTAEEKPTDPEAVMVEGTVAMVEVMAVMAEGTAAENANSRTSSAASHDSIDH